MRSGRVKMTTITGKNGRVYRFKEIVNESCFLPGRFDELLNKKYIEEIAVGDYMETVSDLTVNSPILNQPIDETRLEIITALDKLGVKYSNDLSKNELYELYRRHKR
jgi:hypothetical protein